MDRQLSVEVEAKVGADVTAPSDPIRCDYCGDELPSVASRAHVPTTPSLQRLGFNADKVVCPQCAHAARVAQCPYSHELGSCTKCGWYRFTPWEPAPSPDREKLIAEAHQATRGQHAVGRPWPAATGSEVEAYVKGVNWGADLIQRLAEALAAAPVVDEAKLAEAICREIHSTRWTHRATSTQCEDCWRASVAVAEALRGER